MKTNNNNKVIDARAYFDLSSWLPDIEGVSRMEVIKEWLEIEEEELEG